MSIDASFYETPFLPTLQLTLSRIFMLDTVSWIVSVLTGTAATIVMTLAIAMAGLSLLIGRVHVSRFAKTILGCFVIFGAGTIAAALTLFSEGGRPLPSEEAIVVRPPEFQTNVITEGAYDPYPGASAAANLEAEDSLFQR